jgi:hypothetical protein
MTVVKELSKYKLDLMGLHGTEAADKYKFLCGNGNKNHESGTGFFCT